MRSRSTNSGLTVNTIAGTHVVFFGLDIVKSKHAGFRGFGFKRFEKATGETLWLRGMKTFEAIESHPAKGELFRSNDHPFQSFQWADYSVKPGMEYVYTVVALYGTAGNLKTKAEVEIPVTTEAEIEPGATHSVFFNRGAVATQEYARRFENRPPRIAGVGAYEWLSRGLVEALIHFIGRASEGWELHAAVYEFQWAALFEGEDTESIDASEIQHLSVLKAIREASKRGADVHIIYDDVGGDKDKPPASKNRQAIENARIKSICRGRGNSSKIMHNKFFVLSKGGKPKAVWTGSTNLTENGIFGHSNLGHIVEDEAIAQDFFDYWTRLAEDPKVDKAYREANTEATPIPPDSWTNGTKAIFSPRGTKDDLDALNWYTELASQAKKALFMTFAFGMHDNFKKVYLTDDSVLRMALLESAGAKKSDEALGKTTIQTLRKRPNVVMAIGNRLKTNAFDRWLSEMDAVNDRVHVRWIHTKYMLVDPLGADPVVITGSANFSEASTYHNDENMVAIRGDQRIADIYLGEYIRLYAHYAFREAVKRAVDAKAAGTPSEWKPNYLIDSDDWLQPYFDPTDSSARCLRREYFAGSLSE